MNFEKRKKIIFFDGHCNLCSWSVDLIIKLDRKELFLYAPLSGITSSELGVLAEFPNSELSVIYYRNKEEIFNYSDAIIEICSDLFIFGGIFFVFKLIPRFIRDSFYLFIAKNRYRIFGKKDACRIPTEQEMSRFLD